MLRLWQSAHIRIVIVIDGRGHAQNVNGDGECGLPSSCMMMGMNQISIEE
jgi:hypothetical protein